MYVVFKETTDIKLVSEANAATPGVDMWEGDATGETNVINTTFKDKIYYMSSQNYIDVNGAYAWDTAATYWLWYPIYTGNFDSPTYNLTWYRYMGSGSGDTPIIEPNEDLRFGGGDEKDLQFNASGIWVISNATESSFVGTFRTSDALGNSSIAAWFWVNTSEVYTTSVSDDTFKYGETGDIEVLVKEKSDLELTDDAARIAIYNASGILPGQGTYAPWGQNKYVTDGKLTGIEKNTSFTNAGLWNVETYYDQPAEFGSIINYKDAPYGIRYYNSTTYGTLNPYTIETTANSYNFTLAGPWDPPEYNATRIPIKVEAGKPNLVVTNTTKVYSGFGLRIDINVTDNLGMGIAYANVTLKKGGERYWDRYFPDIFINESTSFNGNYSIEIPRFSASRPGWENFTNGSWTIIVARDLNGDTAEEWNNTEKFIVTTATPPVRLDILDDGDAGTGTSTDNKVNTQAYTPTGDTAGFIDIQFQIKGTSIADVFGRAYYGDDTGEDLHNISVTGDILYPVNDTTLTHSTNGIWTARVIPTGPGGTIDLEIDWPGTGNGSDSKTINIINGTKVSADVTVFNYGDEFDITVTVTDMFNNLQYAGDVYLKWHDTCKRLNQTVPGTGGSGKGLNGEYTYQLLLTDQQGQTAPENITIAAKSAGLNHWGYAKINMQKSHDIVVNVTPSTDIYAGVLTKYDIDILVNGAEPEDYTDITVDCYDEWDNKVSDTWWTDVQSSISGEFDVDDLEIYFPGGNWILYAYNDTVDSEGNNGTVEVMRYSVASDPSTLAWLIDTDVNITFSLTPSNTSGYLQIDNITGTGVNGSNVGESYEVYVSDGQVTIENFNATDLGNLTFDYQPDDGEYKEADGLLKITTATATPNPATIYIGEATTVEITVTHPATGAPIENVRVDLDYNKNATATKLSRLPETVRTDGEGKAQFSVTSEASGNVTIYIERGTDPDNPYVIMSKARKTMTITADPSVNEGGTFIVTAKDVNGNLITDATVNMLFNGVTTSTTTGTLELTAPAVPESLDYRIDATAEGYTNDDTTIKVINEPKVFIDAPEKATEKKSFVVKAGGDDGNSYGIKVTVYKDEALTEVKEEKITAGPDGVKFSLAKGTYYIVASKDNYVDSDAAKVVVAEESGGPGFELLTLIIAIGVAYILLKRRRK
jgi:hypothetical protein